MEIKIIDYASGIIADVLSVQIKEHLDKYLVAEFIDKLKKVDMGRMGADIKAADVISAVVHARIVIDPNRPSSQR